jgi:hypothetical protein
MSVGRGVHDEASDDRFTPESGGVDVPRALVAMPEPKNILPPTR